MSKKKFTLKEAKKIGSKLGVDWTRFGVEEYRTGLNVEMEHGSGNPATNVTHDDPLTTGRIALAHLNEFADYYTRLAKMEKEAKKYWAAKDA